MVVNFYLEFFNNLREPERPSGSPGRTGRSSAQPSSFRWDVSLRGVLSSAAVSPGAQRSTRRVAGEDRGWKWAWLALPRRRPRLHLLTHVTASPVAVASDSVTRDKLSRHSPPVKTSTVQPSGPLEYIFVSTASWDGWVGR